MKVISTRRCYTRISQLSHVLKTASGKAIAVFFMALLSFQSLKANDIYAISGGNLIAFKSANPGTITFSVPLSGVTSGQVIEGLDFRPATGELFAIGYVAASGLTQVYSINYKTGVATAIGMPVTLATNMVRIGMDFNPTVDRIRVTAFGGQNYRLNPITGGIAATDGNLNYASGDVHAGVNPRIEAVAYTNSYFGGTPALVTATTIYYYDYGFDDLANSANPNGGVLNTVGNAGIVSLSGNGLDLDIVTNPATGIQCGYLTANASGSTQTLYSINLATGKASSKGVVGANISEMAVFLAPPTPELVYAITSAGSLVSFNANNPSTFLKTSTLSGVTAGQVVEGLDFRSATGELFALGYAASSGQAQIYTVDTVTGTATPVAAAVTLAANMTNVTMDFNPMADRIRVTSAQGNNYRLVPTTGALAFTDGNLTYAPSDIRAGNTPAIAAVAYTNSFPGTTTTTIYYYDLALNSLALSTNPNGGVLTTVGPSGLLPTNATGLDMDISSNPGIVPNTAFISANTGTSNMLYSLNLTNGNARMLGTIGSSGTITDFAVYIAPPTPSRTVYALSGGSLIKFNTTTPGTVTTVGTLSGIVSGQTVEGLDFRPATLDLYAVGYNANDGSTRIYIIDTVTAIATPVGTANITLATGMSRLGVDFNPTVDRIRLTSATGQNYRLNPITGALQIQDGTLSYAPGDASIVVAPNVNAVGYTNSMNAATTTRLYYYDYMLDALATTSLPNDGVLNTIGRSGIIASTGNGLDMDIVRTPSNNTNTGFLSATVSGTTSNLYTINLATGEARLVGAIGAAAGVTEMAIRLAGLDGSRTLPITLISFTGRKEGKNSQLNWTTETEVNNSHFILERSVDGAKFVAISGNINSAATEGNSTSTLNYTYKDLSAAKGVNYYRLVQMDKDGKITYSKTVSLKFDGGYEVTMYPNPVSSVINVNGFIAEKADLQIKVTDINGRMMDVTSLKNQSGNWNARLNASNLRSGLYYVTVTKGQTVIHTQTIQKN